MLLPSQSETDERIFPTSTSGAGDKFSYPVFDARPLIGPRCDANGECAVPYAEHPTQNKM